METIIAKPLVDCAKPATHPRDDYRWVRVKDDDTKSWELVYSPNSKLYTWAVVERHDMSLGQLALDVSAIELYRSDWQSSKSPTFDGYQLLQELTGLQGKYALLNVNVLEYLMGHQDLIPKEWRGKKVAFWGTVYRHSSHGWFLVLYLYWNGVGWSWGTHPLNHPFRASYLAAVLPIQS